MPRIPQRIAQVFRALHYRNFRLFFIGQGISLVGTWMQQVAMSWLVYQITLSPVLLGVVSFAGQIPVFILSPLTGVLADRYNRHRILLCTQTLSMLQALLLAWLTLTGQVEVWQLVSLSLLMGMINSVDIPTRQSFLIEMVEEKKVLSNAIALNSLAFNMARLVGPAIAGLLLVYTSEGICFLANGVSFIAVLASLMAMRLKRVEHHHHGIRVWVRLREGFHYAFGFVPIRRILILLAVINLTGSAYMVLLPVIAKDVLGGTSKTYGMLVTSAGVGALFATVHLASRRSVLGLGRIIVLGTASFGAGLIGLAWSNVFWVCSLLIMLGGYSFMASLASCNIILQTVVDDDKRGRVMSFYAMAFMGTMPIGSLLAGVIADQIGVSATLALQGACSLATALTFALLLPSFREALRPIYRQIGVLAPEPPTVGL